MFSSPCCGVIQDTLIVRSSELDQKIDQQISLVFFSWQFDILFSKRASNTCIKEILGSGKQMVLLFLFSYECPFN